MAQLHLYTSNGFNVEIDNGERVIKRVITKSERKATRTFGEWRNIPDVTVCPVCNANSRIERRDYLGLDKHN